MHSNATVTTRSTSCSGGECKSGNSRIATAAATRNNAGAGTWIRSLNRLDSTASNPTTALISTSTANAPLSPTATPPAVVDDRSGTQPWHPCGANRLETRHR